MNLSSIHLMHLIIAFAYSSSPACREALSCLKLPYLEKLLPRLRPVSNDMGVEDSFSPPHERALARAMNLPLTDGLIPWAAQQAQSRDIRQAHAKAWAFITPCHWQNNTRHVTMSGPGLPDFSEQESQSLMAAMQPYFAQDGITLYFDQPERWLASGALFDGLASSSLDRVVGRNVASWMPGASVLQRLQSEMQMLLYTHPINQAREARGALAVNSFWISGTGVWPLADDVTLTSSKPTVITALREPALRENWQAWGQAWQTIDRTECAALLAAPGTAKARQLTLCGERNAQTFVARSPSILSSLMSHFGSKGTSLLLEQL
jgi:hypothetical protein